MIAALVAAAALQDGASADPVEGFRQGNIFPGRHLLRDDGGSWTRMSGRPVVVLVVAYWCDTWKAMRDVTAYVQRSKIDVDWVVLSIDGRWGELGRDWKRVTRLRGAFWADFDKVPTCLAVGPNGAIVARHEGTLSVAGLTKLADIATRSP